MLNRKLQSWKHGFQKKVGWTIHQRFVYKWSLWFGATQPKRRRSSCQGRSPREWLSWITVWLTGLDSTTPNDPFLRVILMGFLWPPQVTCPSFFFFIKADVCRLLQCWERNPGLWVEPRALSMSSRHSATRLYPSPALFLLKLWTSKVTEHLWSMLQRWGRMVR